MFIPLLLVPAIAGAQTTVCPGKTTLLTAIEEKGHTYEWEIYNDPYVNFAKVPGNCPTSAAIFTDGNKGLSVHVKWLRPGIYFYKVTSRDERGCAMNLKIGMLKVIATQIEAIITGERQIGVCDQVKLDGSGSSGDIIKYEWTSIDKGGELTQRTGKTTEFRIMTTYSGSLPAEFRVKLIVTDSSGETKSDTIIIKADRKPVAEIFSSGKLEKDGSLIADGTPSTGTSLRYRWSTNEGEIIGSANLPTVRLTGAGAYLLEITDIHGCKSTVSFKFPSGIHQIIANPDYARTSWARDTIIPILDNDRTSAHFVQNTLRVTALPLLGTTRVNTNGTITYTPHERHPGRDQFVYEVCDEENLCASATVTVDIYDSGLTVPEGFSPNGDGENENLVFKGLENYLKSQLYVYTRSGQMVYSSVDYQNNWDGSTIKNTLTSTQLVPTGTYYYVLKLGGTSRTIKGFVYIGY